MTAHPESEVLSYIASREAYLGLPKELGRASVGHLLGASVMLGESKRPGDQIVAAEARIEATLIKSCKENQDIDSLLSDIDRSLALIEDAKNKFQEVGLDTGNTSYLHNVYRLNNLQIFGDTFKDIVCGELTSRTQDEAFLGLQSLLGNLQESKLLSTENAEHQSTRVGIMSEVIMELLLLIEGRGIVIPSFYKADSGIYEPDRAHDLILIQEDSDERLTNALRMQVKSGESQVNGSEEARNYASDILVIYPPQTYRALLISELLKKGSLSAARRGIFIEQGVVEMRQKIDNHIQQVKLEPSLP